jgi:hypothetical protein
MMKTLSEQVDLLEVNNRNTIYQMKKWREHAESLELRLDNLIEERDETLVNRDIAEDAVLELAAERDMLAEENASFANYLEYHGYSQCEVDNIAQGWHGSVSDRLEDAEELKAEVKALRFRLRKIANYTVMENGDE